MGKRKIFLGLPRDNEPEYVTRLDRVDTALHCYHTLQAVEVHACPFKFTNHILGSC